MTCYPHLLESQVPHLKGHLRTRGPPPGEAWHPERAQRQSKRTQLASERGTERQQTATKITLPGSTSLSLSLMQPLTPMAANWGDTIQGLWEGSQEATGPPGPALPPPAAPTDTHAALQPSRDSSPSSPHPLPRSHPIRGRPCKGVLWARAHPWQLELGGGPRQETSPGFPPAPGFWHVIKRPGVPVFYEL